MNIDHGLEMKDYNGSLLVLSSLQAYFKPIVPYGFAVKYVSKGLEKYHLGKETYEVTEGKYLLLNSSHTGHVEIDSHQPVEGICINITTTLLENMVASMVRPDAAIPDADLGKFFTTSLFIESAYEASQTELGKALLYLNQKLQSREISLDNLSPEFFYNISEKIVADYTPVCRQLQSIPAVKPLTKKELYKKILRAKEYIDAAFATPLTTESMAKECCLSEYHFLRLFKGVFRLSPHQYLIRKRLECGRQMLERQQTPVSVVALECGFSDIHGFSGAFRNYFGFNPSSLLFKN